MRCPLNRYSVAVALLACGIAGSSSAAQACMLDQKPSLSADGRLARINAQVPRTQAQLATWTYFDLPGTYAVGRAIVLVENRREVARMLTAQAMRYPCGWVFGDGRMAYGWTVRHAYARPGRQRIRVYAWDAQSGRWDLFDQATIVIRP